MELEIKKSSASELHFILKGERHTLPNLLRETLLQDPNVTFAAYTLPHPLGEDSEFIVKTKGKNPKAAIATAIKKIDKQLADFESAFKASK
jgi:DNA-directed RNA polymerase subunit L